MKNNTTTLALPKAKLQPPPKKSEIIDAMTKLRVQKLNEESKKGAERHAILKTEIESDLVQLAFNVSGLPRSGVIGYRYDDEKFDGFAVRIEISGKHMPKQLKDKIRELRKLPERARTYDFFSVKKDVTAAVNGMIPHDERVAALLKDDSAKESMEKMMEAMFQ